MCNLLGKDLQETVEDVVMDNRATGLEETLVELVGRIRTLHDDVGKLHLGFFDALDIVEGCSGPSGNGRPWGEELLTSLGMANLSCTTLLRYYNRVRDSGQLRGTAEAQET